MQKSVRYRSDAKMILGIGLLLCAIACAVYGVLLIPAVKGIKFEWEYLAIIGGAAVLFALISLYLLCLSNACARREEKLEAMRRNTELAVEPEPEQESGESTPCLTLEIKAGVDCTKGDPLKKLDAEKLKKIGSIAVPVAAVAVAALAIRSNSKYARRAKKRRDVYRWLG